MNKILVCLSIFFLGTALVAQTILSRGDLAIVGINSTISPSSQDEISFVCFQNITKGTEIQLTDNGYEACTPGTWSSAEGGAKLTRTGSTIPAGTVITMRDAYTTGNAIQFTYPDADWTTTDLVPGVVTSAFLNLNSKGDQLYFAQNGTWTNIPNSSCTVSSTATADVTTPNADYPGVNGRILFGFSTSGGWNRLQNSTGESGLYPSTDCFTMALSSASKYNKYTGLLSAATQTEWLSRISNQNNWSGYSTSNAYFAAKPDFHATKLNIDPLGAVSNPAWRSPKNLICAADNIIDLNTLVTGTKGGNWTGEGVTTNGSFDPKGLNGTYSINYAVNYNSGTNNCQLTQTDTIEVALNITPTFDPITILQGSIAPDLPTNSTNIPPIFGTWNSPINSAVKGITHYTFTPNNTRCNIITTFGVDVIDSALAPESICARNPLILTGATEAESINWYKKGTNTPIKTANQVAPTEGVTVAGNGTKGSSSSQLGTPLGVAVDSKGNVYVCDSMNKQVSKWAPGAKTSTIAAGGNGWGNNLNQFKQPIGIYIDAKDNLYISDYNASRVLRFPPNSTSATNGVVVAGGNNSGSKVNQLNDPTGVYVDTLGNVYVADAANYRVVKWGPGATTGVEVIKNPNGVLGFWFPSGVYAAGKDSLYVTDANPILGGGGVHRYPLSGNATTNYNNGKAFGTSFSQPASPFVDTRGNLYITEHSSNDVLKYQNGSFVKVAGGTTGKAANQLNLPSGLWVVNGAIYVGDFNNYRVQKWAPSIDTTFTPTAAGNYYAVIKRYSGALDTTNTILVSDTSSSVTNISICPTSSYTFNGKTYTKAGTYKDTLTNKGGCDSIAILNLTVKDTTSSVTRMSICKNSSYTFNGTAYTTAGTYKTSLTNSVGCDSVATLILTVKDTATSITNKTICAGQSFVFSGSSYSKAGTYSVHFSIAGNCDSIAYLVLTVNDTTHSVTKATICEGDSYIFNGIKYTKAGTYSSTLTNAVGCDSIAYLNLSLKDTTNSFTTVSICKGDSYLFNENNYMTAGTYFSKLTNAAGCDSTAYLILAVKDTTFSVTKASICKGDSYLFNGNNFTTAGTYFSKLTNAAGCDSTAYLILTVKDTTSSVTRMSICKNSSFTFNGTTYTTAGTYKASLTNSVGCDSTATLILTIRDTATSITNKTVCSGQSFVFSGSSYTKAGTYSATFSISGSCDSVAYLVLTVKDTTNSVTKASICKGDSYVFNGIKYNAAGTYSSILTNAAGCDSTAYLVLSTKDSTNSITKASICKGDSYLFNRNNYMTAGTYFSKLTNAAGCDSTAYLVLSIKDTTFSVTKASICKGDSYLFNGNNYTTAGTYFSKLTNAAGCDSTAYLILTIKDTTSSVTIASICKGSSYTFNGTLYDQAGTYSAKLINSQGCDSTAVLMLSLKDTTSSVTTASICQGSSYTFNGNVYNTKGTYSVHITKSTGCDSIAVLILSFKTPSYSTTKTSICKGSSYTFNGNTYSNSGTYTARLTNSIGCDSTATLILSIKDTTTSITNARICSGNSFLFNGSNYTTQGTYTVHLTNNKGCDSAATLVLIVDDRTTYPPDGATAVCKGQSIQLSNFIKGGKWSSLSPTIATIDSISGILTGINTGIAKIQYTINASCGLQIVSQDYPVLGVKPSKVSAIPIQATCIKPLSGGFTVTINGTEKPYLFTYDGEKYNSTTLIPNLGVGSYAVGIINNNDCIVDSIYNINVTMSTNASCDTFYVPTGFVPTSSRNSGYTKLLKPFGGSNSIQSMVFRVFNRGGFLIFETHDLYSGWDGTINGILQNAGTYIWSLEYTPKDGKRRFANGTSVLLR